MTGVGYESSLGLNCNLIASFSMAELKTIAGPGNLRFRGEERRGEEEIKTNTSWSCLEAPIIHPLAGADTRDAGLPV